MTRSGRCFTPEELRKAKGKEVVDVDQELEVNKSMTEEESNEFLKLIKHSEYCIVDQLKKDPCQNLPYGFDTQLRAASKCLAKGIE